MNTRKFLFAALLLMSGSVYAQIEPVINEEWIPANRMDQQESFKEGDYAFPAKPRNMWHIGLNVGVPQINGDVPSQPFGGSHSPAFGVGLNIRKGLGYVTSLRAHLMYGNAYGQSYTEGTFRDNKTLNGQFANNDPAISNYSEGADYDSLGSWVPNYKTTIYHGSLDIMFNLNNINFHKAAPKFLVYGFAGIGAFAFETAYDALDANGNEYDYNALLAGLQPQNDFKQERLDAIHGAQDGEYETQGEVANPVKLGANETITLNPSLSVGFGISYKIGNRVELGLEHRMSHYFDDLADGYRWEGDGEFTDHYDMFHYSNLTLGFNLGKKSDIPMWEKNPLNFVYNKLAELDPSAWLKDTDDDGVIDTLDREPSTPAGTPVDTHGVSLDSDKDGCKDSEDPEPFSTPNLPIENCQNVFITENRVNELIDARIALIPSVATNWYLPMIFFDLDKSAIRADAVPQLVYVADIMSKYTKLTVEVVGHTDTRASESYNSKLSENRAKEAIKYLGTKGIKESRFVMKYSGETDTLIPSARNESEHQTNRRVEFHIVK